MCIERLQDVMKKKFKEEKNINIVHFGFRDNPIKNDIQYVWKNTLSTNHDAAFFFPSELKNVELPESDAELIQMIESFTYTFAGYSLKGLLEECD